MRLKSSVAFASIACALLCCNARAENWPRFRGPTGQESSTSQAEADTRIQQQREYSPGKHPSPASVGQPDRLERSRHRDHDYRQRGEWPCVSTGSIQRRCRLERGGINATDAPQGRQEFVRHTDAGDRRPHGVCRVRRRRHARRSALTTASACWTDERVKFYSQHGLGASPILHENLLIMPFDGSSPAPDTKVGWKIPWERRGSSRSTNQPARR